MKFAASLFFQNTNCAFAFASLQYNKRPVGPGGVQSEKIQGGVYHLPSALYPRDPNKKGFANYYVADAIDAAKQRQFGSLRGQLNAQVRIYYKEKLF